MSDVSFSVIIPMYNVADLLAISLNSVRAQTYGNYEVLCVDDGSTDDTLAVARTLIAGDERFRIIASEHKGRASAMRNIGLREAKNDYIVFLDSDDQLIPAALATIAAALAAHHLPDVLMGSGYSGTLDAQGHFCEEDRIKNCAAETHFSEGKKLLEYFAMHHLTLHCYGCINIYKRTLLCSHGLFQSEKILFLEDHDWLPKVLFQAQNVGFFETPFYCYIRRGTSITLNFTENSLQDVLRVVTSAGEFVQAHRDEISVTLKRFWANHVLSAFYWFFFQSMYKAKVSDPVRKKVLRAYLRDAEQRRLFKMLSSYAPRVKRIMCYFVLPTRFGLFFPAFWLLRGFYFPLIMSHKTNSKTR